MTLLNKEFEAQRINRMIEQKKQDLTFLEYDLKSVSSDLSKKSIAQHINSINKAIVRLEFKQWKLEGELV